MSFLNWKAWIPQWVKDAYRKTNHFFKNRWVRLGVQVSIILISLVYLALNYLSTKNLLSELRINYSTLIFAWLLTTLCVFLGGLGWWLTLKGMGQSVGIASGLRIHLLSNLAKYIPGYAWQLVRKAALTHDQGLSAGMISKAMLLELFQLVFTGLGIVIGMIPDNLPGRWIGNKTFILYLPFLQTIILIIMAAFLIGLPFLLRKYLAQTSSNRILPWAIWGAALASLGGWLLFGFAFWMIGIAIERVSISTISLFTFTLAASFLTGLAIIIVPGSIGIREGVMVFFLGPVIGGPIAVLVAALSRLIVTMSEIIGALGWEFFAYRLHHHQVE